MQVLTATQRHLGQRRFADEGVREPEATVAEIADEPGSNRRFDAVVDVRPFAAGDRGQDRGVDVDADHGRGRHRVERVGGEAGQTSSEHGLDPGGEDPRPGAGIHDRSCSVQQARHLRDEQRIAARQLLSRLDHGRARCGPRDGGDDLADRVARQPAQRDRRVALRDREHGFGPHSRHDDHRQVRELGFEHLQKRERVGIRPLQVVEGNDTPVAISHGAQIVESAVQPEEPLVPTLPDAEGDLITRARRVGAEIAGRPPRRAQHLVPQGQPAGRAAFRRPGPVRRAPLGRRLDEPGLADPGLSRDDDVGTVATLGSVERGQQLVECVGTTNDHGRESHRRDLSSWAITAAEALDAAAAPVASNRTMAITAFGGRQQAAIITRGWPDEPRRGSSVVSLFGAAHIAELLSYVTGLNDRSGLSGGSPHRTPS